MAVVAGAALAFGAVKCRDDALRRADDAEMRRLGQRR
jgi:hypothetical protein